MYWIILAIIFVIILGIGIPLGLRQRRAQNQLISEGRMIKRDVFFMRYAEIFTLSGGDFERVLTAINSINFAGTGAKVESYRDRQTILFKAYDWSAQLYRTASSGDKDVYQFSFTNWRTYRGAPQNDVQMNLLLTGVEKSFLWLDPYTQVENIQIKTKTKSGFF